MKNQVTTMKIAVFPGDGIGPEVMAPCIELLKKVTSIVGGIELDFQTVEAGAAYYQKHGVSLPEEGLDTARKSDAIILGAMGLPSIRYPDGTEIAPQLELRETLELFAGVRPIRTIPGLPTTLADKRADKLDLVLIRESTEGLFAARGKTQMQGDQVAMDTMVISRNVCENLFDFAAELGSKRKAEGYAGRVTCVDKANVLGSFAFFRKIFDERTRGKPNIIPDYAYVDAMGLNLLKRPWEYDVLVTENMFGDILSDIGAALIGGMGFAPSADIGLEHAVFQPCHGSAPDIAGEGKANPIAMFLSGAMMLTWLGDKHHCESATRAGKMLTQAIDLAFVKGDLLPIEIGGTAGTDEIFNSVLHALNTSK